VSDPLTDDAQIEDLIMEVEMRDKVYMVNTRFAHIRKSKGDDYKLVVDESQYHIEVPCARILHNVFYMSTEVMTQDRLLHIVTNMKHGVRVMVPWKVFTQDPVFLCGIVIPQRCKLSFRQQHSFVAVKIGKITRRYPLDHVMVRDSASISPLDPIYQRWVWERDEAIRGEHELTQARRVAWWKQFTALEKMTMDLEDRQNREDMTEQDIIAALRIIQSHVRALSRDTRRERLLVSQKHALNDLLNNIDIQRDGMDIDIMDV